MSPRWPSASRLIVAALALYALLLQPFVAAATPAFAQAGVICHAAPDGSGAPAGHDHPCCAAACAVSGMPAAAFPSAVVSGPPRDARPFAWMAVGAPRATGPPTHAASARGPPAV